MKVGEKTYYAEKPSEFKLNKLFDNEYEAEYNEDIKEEAIYHGEEKVNQFVGTHYLSHCIINNYDETVSALIWLKYSISDEIALLKKIQNKTDMEEVDEYCAYVEKCKKFARAYWGIIK